MDSGWPNFGAARSCEGCECDRKAAVASRRFVSAQMTGRLNASMRHADISCRHLLAKHRARHRMSDSMTQAAGIFIRGVDTAAPATRYTKAECLTAFELSDWYGRLDARSHLIARTVLQRDNGIEARRLAVATLDEVFRIDPDTLAQRFLAHAPNLAASAAAQALQAAELAVQDIDAVVVSTCTGYLCPGLSGYVTERLGLRSDVQAFDLVGQGCAAALPNMQLGRALLASGACDMSCRSVSRSAAPRCTSTTIPGC